MHTEKLTYTLDRLKSDLNIYAGRLNTLSQKDSLEGIITDIEMMIKLLSYTLKHLKTLRK